MAYKFAAVQDVAGKRFDFVIIGKMKRAHWFQYGLLNFLSQAEE